MPSKLIDPATLPTMSFDWGVIKPLVAADNTDDPAVSLMHVVLLPGQGHERHNHPDADEILYILAGTGDQMVDDAEPFPVRAGHAVFIPTGAFHSTVNTGWEPLRCWRSTRPRAPSRPSRACPTTARSRPARRRRSRPGYPTPPAEGLSERHGAEDAFERPGGDESSPQPPYGWIEATFVASRAARSRLLPSRR